jgi:hypothetical protein
MRVEQRGGGLRQRESDTRPYAERTLTVTGIVPKVMDCVLSCPPGSRVAGLMYSGAMSDGALTLSRAPFWDKIGESSAQPCFCIQGIGIEPDLDGGITDILVSDCAETS